MANAAEAIKKEQTLLGEGEGARKRAIMIADGALTQKLNAYKEVNAKWAEAFANYTGNIVPQISSGETGSNNGAVQFMQMMGMKAAKDLSLEISIPKQK